MTDISVFTVEERLIAAVWVHDRIRNDMTMEDIRSAFTERFGKPAPSRSNLYLWEKKVFETGSVLDQARSGRPETRKKTCAGVQESLQQSPKKSTRKRSAELGIPRATMMDHMKKDLDVKPYKPMSVNQLSDEDMDRRKEFCEKFLNRFPDCPRNHRKIIFSDECAIYKSSKSRNIYFWAKENPFYKEEVENNPPHVMIWAALTSEHLIGPYFFDGNVNQESYANMIRNWFIPKLIELGIKDCVWLQQDGAPAHFALPVRALLNAEFPDRWIGRGSNSFAWPPRSPDLTTPDNSLWGLIKGQVSGIRYETIDQLKHAIIAAFASVSRNSLKKMAQRTWRRMELCKNNEGQHTDPLDH